MRTSLLGSLVDVVRKNHSRKVPRIRVFELGRVFLRDASAQRGPLSVAGVRQPMRIAAAAYGPALAEQWEGPERLVDYFDLKADMEALCAPLTPRLEPARHPALHPGRAARVLLDGRPAGWLGELHPKWQQKYELPHPALLFELDAEPLLAVPIPHPRVPSRFPPVVRDIALVFDAATPVQAVLDAISAGKPPIVQSVRLFSLYRGAGLPPGSKSLAFRVVMQHTERTLTDAEADAARDALVALLGEKFSAKLRTSQHAGTRNRGKQGVGDDFDEGRTCRPAVREGRAEQARGQGHGRGLLRRDPRGAGAGGKRQAFRLRQLPAARQATAPGTHPKDRRGNPHQRPPCRDFPRQPEAQGHGGESAPWNKAAGKLSSRRSRPSATSPSVR